MLYSRRGYSARTAIRMDSSKFCRQLGSRHVQSLRVPPEVMQIRRGGGRAFFTPWDARLRKHILGVSGKQAHATDFC